MHQPIETKELEPTPQEVRSALFKAFEELSKEPSRYESFRRPLTAEELAMRFG